MPIYGTHDFILGQSGCHEHLEIYIMHCPTPSHQNCTPPLGARRRSSGKYHALHKEPEIPRHLGHTKPRRKDMAHHETSYTCLHTQLEPRGHQLTRRAPPVKASSDARTWCSSPPVRDNFMPLHLSQEGLRNSDEGHK